MLTHLRTARVVKGVKKGLGADRMGELTLELKRICCYVASRQHKHSGVSVSLDRLDTWLLISGTSTEASRLICIKRSNQALLPQARAGDITEPEMMRVIARCEEVMGRVQTASADAKWTATARIRRDYVAHLITAVIALCIAPRSQCLAWMTELDVVETGLTEHPRLRIFFHVGHPLNPYPQYLIAIPAQKQKNRKAWTMIVPTRLTAPLDWYRAHLCVAGQLWVFPTERRTQNRGGMARYTKRVCKAVIGRPITAHRFRNATATLFNRTNLSDAQKHSLIFSSGHSAQTHASYVRDDLFKNQTDFQQTIIDRVDAQLRENEKVVEEVESGLAEEDDASDSDSDDGSDSDSDECVGLEATAAIAEPQPVVEAVAAAEPAAKRPRLDFLRGVWAAMTKQSSV